MLLRRVKGIYKKDKEFRYNSTYRNVNGIIYGLISSFIINTPRYALSYTLKNLYHGLGRSFRIGKSYLIYERYNGLLLGKYKLNEFANNL